MMTVHFVGICGTAMATLAAMLKDRGFAVRGSDQHVYPPMSDFLAAREIPCQDGFDADHITADVDLVVIGNAVSRGNPEVEAVLDRKLRYRSLPEMVRETFLWDRRSIVVAGTHGKTTTASLVSWLLADGGREPSFLVGGLAANFGSSYRLGQGREFVIEGDEYDSAFFDKTAKFLKYLPDVAVVGNLEFDHADIYADVEAIKSAVRQFVTLVPRHGLLVLGADSPEAFEMRAGAPCRVTTFGLGETARVARHSGRGGARRDDLHGGASWRPGHGGARSTGGGVQRAERAGGIRGRLRGGAGPDDNCRVGCAVRGRPAAPGDPRAGTGSDRLRRLRPSPDRGPGDIGRGSRVESVAADLGAVRAAVCDRLPTGLSGGLCRGVQPGG